MGIGVCKVWSGEWGLGSVKWGVWSGEWGLGCVKCEV